MKKISIYCFILISLGFIGCTSKTHEKTIEDFDIREMSLQVDTLYSRMTQAERVAQLYGIRPKEIMEDGKLLLEKCREKIPDGIGHICQYACALDMEPNELRDFVRDLQNYLMVGFNLVGCGDIFSFKDKLAGIFLVNTCQAGC